MRRASLFFILIALSFSTSWAATSLPRNLTEADRTRALEILGFGSAPKLLDNPYPLGGYSGIEVGFSSEYIPMEDLAALGSKTSDKGEYNYYTLSFAKGLYYNVDVHLHFTPFIQGEKIQSYGGQVRWGFFEANFFPMSLSTVVYAGGANFSNLINVSTLGMDVIGTVALDNVAIFFGGGRIRAIGRFVGGPDGITDSADTTEEDVTDNHTVFGINFDISKMFLTLQIDRYTDSVYGGKIGFRF